MSSVARRLPICRPLPADFSLPDAFARLSRRPHCLWLDSASTGPRAAADGDDTSSEIEDAGLLGRYSFLTADPVATLVARVEDESPWPILHDWCRALPPDHDPELPPFQGGIAGLLGYEAATWLEPVGTAELDDLSTPAVSLGLYDWTIATDHVRRRSWIIAQGLSASDPADRMRAAQQRVDQVLQWLGEDLQVNENLQVNTAQQQLQPGAVELSHQYPTDRDHVQSNLTSDQFQQRVSEIVRSICAGDSFQVNFAQRLLHPCLCRSPELFLRLRKHNPAPFCAYYGGDGFEVLSSSPEGFLKVRDRVVETRPIKGTTPRTGDPQRDAELAQQLSASEKDRAENIMIVDLMRNDLSRVCEDESVQVTQLCEVERYQYVQHLVSAVQGRLRSDQTVVDLLQACFPGGSVTGAPKIEAMRTIARLEPHRRGPYCGSIGYISCGGDADFNILIRTITARGGYWQIPVGGGITARSNPVSEEAETWNKAEGMLRAISD